MNSSKKPEGSGCQKKHKRIPLSGPIVKEKSIQLNYKLGGEETVEFTASEGWLWQWKATEYQIVYWNPFDICRKKLYDVARHLDVNPFVWKSEAMTVSVYNKKL